MRKVIDYVGREFGFLTVIRFEKKLPPNGYYYICKCRCGILKSVCATNLRAGTTRSCGKCGLVVQGNRSHGLTRTATWNNWNAMICRCRYPNSAGYLHYGGRGIKICDRIVKSPASIVELIGLRPAKYLTIDRIDNDGHYSCGQCSQCKSNKWKFNIRWATRKQQSRNRRNNRPLTINGVTMLAVEWAEFVGITPTTIYHRINRGESGSDLIRPMRRSSIR